MFCKKCNKKFENKPVSNLFCSIKCRNSFQSSESYYRNRDKRLNYSKKDEVKEHLKEKRKTETFKKNRNEKMRTRRKNDPLWKLKQNVKDRIRKDMTNIFENVSYSEENLFKYLGYSIEDLYNYLLADKNVEDYLNNKYELDHIIPYNKYYMIEIGDDEFKKCWNLRNLRLIPKMENKSRKRWNFPWDEVIRYNLLDLLPNGPCEIWLEKSNFIKGAISSTF